MAREITKVEIEKIKEEIAYRQSVITPQCIAEVQRTRALGDLSENDEYRSAKRELNHNYSRIRYLKGLLENSKVVEYTSEDDAVGMFDTVTILYVDDEEERKITIVTPLRNDVLHDRISNESPLGKALMGHRVGDMVDVHVNEKLTLAVKILALEKGEDDNTLTIN